MKVNTGITENISFVGKFVYNLQGTFRSYSHDIYIIIIIIKIRKIHLDFQSLCEVMCTCKHSNAEEQCQKLRDKQWWKSYARFWSQAANFSLRTSDNSCFQLKLFHTIIFGSGWKQGEKRKRWRSQRHFALLDIQSFLKLFQVEQSEFLTKGLVLFNRRISLWF